MVLVCKECAKEGCCVLAFAHVALCALGCARWGCMSVSAHGRAMRLCAHVVVCRRVLHTWVCVCTYKTSQESAKEYLHLYHLR